MAEGEDHATTTVGMGNERRSKMASLCKGIRSGPCLEKAALSKPLEKNFAMEKAANIFVQFGPKKEIKRKRYGK